MSPCEWITSNILFGILWTRFMKYWMSICVVHTFLMMSWRCGTDVGFSSLTLSFIIFHAFSIGLRSGLLPGHSNTQIFFFWRPCLTFREVWHGAPSCMKMEVPWMEKQSYRWSFNTPIYRSAFMVVFLGRKNRPPLPNLALKHAHTMTDGLCFTVLTVNLLSYRLELDGRRTLTRCEENTYKRQYVMKYRNLRERKKLKKRIKSVITFFNIWTEKSQGEV